MADEVANALEVGNATLFRYGDGGSGEIVAAYDEGPEKMPVGARLTLEGDNVAAMVQRTGAAARMDSHEPAAGSTAASDPRSGPTLRGGRAIIVDGRLWGAAIVGSLEAELPPPDTAERLTDFAEFVAMAVANAEARGELIASRARIVAAGDEAMRRIERDLHDGAQQRLVALGLRIRSLQVSLPRRVTWSARLPLWVTDSLRRARSCGRFRTAFIRRCCPKGGCARPCGPFVAAPPYLSS